MTQITLEFQTLAHEFRQSTSAVGWLNANVELEQDILHDLDEDDGLGTFFRQQTLRSETVKSLHLPLNIIPASLHPAD